MIKSLQGLRVLAMLAIFFFHAGLIPNGIFPVTFFFILSGFITYYVYYNKIDSMAVDYGIKDHLRFGINRIKKLYFMHILTFILSVVIRYKWIMKFSLIELIIMGSLNLTLFQTFFPKYSLSFNNLSWFLGTTFICYLFSLGLIRKIKNSTYKPLFLLILFLTIQMVLVILSPKITDDYGWFLYMSPYYRIFDFIVGMILAKLFLEGIPDLKRSIYILGEFFSIVLLVFAWGLSFYLPMEYTRGIIYSPAFILGIYFFSFERGWISKFLCLPVFQKLAIYSFEFYMIHELILIFFRQIFYSVETYWVVKNIIVAVPSFIVTFILVVLLNKVISKINPDKSLIKVKVKLS